MSERETKFLTTGEFASKAGVTIRTLRYYDKIGLLKPSCYNDHGNRMYSRKDFARLQKILTLKFIGISLEDISSIIKYDINDQDFKKSLEIQRDVIENKIQHMFMVQKAIDETVQMIDNENVLNWDKFVNIINVINMDKKWPEQYKNASNLRARIRIHELFSTNKYGWMAWFFDQLEIDENSHILELGCGDASLWVRNIHKIPDGFNITLTDFSEGMLEDAKKNLSKNASRFKFSIVDVEDIPYEDSSFDVVIANHMLYHVHNIERALSEIKRVLKPGGRIYASTVGKNHMAEMRDILYKFDSGAIRTKSWDVTEKFQLENGMAQVSKWFVDVKLKRYEDSLLVTEAGPLVDYLFSMPDNIKENFNDEKLKQFVKFLEAEILKSGGIFITKDTGFFEGIKKSN